MIKFPSLSLAVLATAVAALAQAPTVDISIGVRETGSTGVPFTFIGDNAFTTGGIEWINLDGQTLTLDGTWQQFTFDIANDPITAFAGSSANGVIDGQWGSLEHVRVRNSGGYGGPMTLWIDDIADTVSPSGTPQTTVFGDFEGYADDDEVMFQEPTFSGSTSGNINPGATSGVDNYTASRTASYRFDLTFASSTPSLWARLTTFNVGNQPNPMVRFDQGSTITFWMRGGVAQPNLGSQGPGNARAEMVGLGLQQNQASTYYASGASPNAPGALFVSLANQPDLPFLGGNLVSFLGNFASVALLADANGRVSFSLNGTPGSFDVVFQTALFDSGLPTLVSFSNANLIEFGR